MLPESITGLCFPWADSIVWVQVVGPRPRAHCIPVCSWAVDTYSPVQPPWLGRLCGLFLSALQISSPPAGAAGGWSAWVTLAGSHPSSIGLSSAGNHRHGVERVRITTPLCPLWGPSGLHQKPTGPSSTWFSLLPGSCHFFLSKYLKSMGGSSANELGFFTLTLKVPLYPVHPLQPVCL